MIAKTASIAKLITMADGSPRVTIDFNEMTGEQFSELYKSKLEGEIDIIICKSEMVEDLVDMLNQLKE